MKMETVIRAPTAGVVAKIAHKEGVCCSELFLIYSVPVETAR